MTIPLNAPVTITTGEALNLGATRRALVVTMANAALPKRVRTVAERELTVLDGLTFLVTLRCIACGQPYPFEADAHTMASWVDHPRGICGTCSANAERTEP